LIGWRFIFYINIPIGLIGFVLALKYIRDNKTTAVKIDYIGTSMLIILLSFLSYGVVDIAGHGVSTFNMVLIILGLLLFIPFIITEMRVKDPVIELKAFKERILAFSLLAAFLQAVGYLSVIFMLTMYLQGIRGFSPLYASLLLVPGYVLASILAPFMGRLSDKIGAGIVATVGIFFMAAGLSVYFLLNLTSSIYLVISGSIIAGFGGSMFWPSNNSAVMSGAPRKIYGSISGLLRTLTNMGTLLSYVITITVATTTVPRAVAFEVFLGIGKLTGRVSTKFLTGIHYALLVSLILLVLAGIFSFVRARAHRKVENNW
jgi:MFS family permease